MGSDAGQNAITSRAEPFQQNSAMWQDSEDLCVLTDSERCLAHTIKIQSLWLAFDATHLSPSGHGFAFLGAREELDDAKDLAECSLKGRRTRVSIGNWTRARPPVETVRKFRAENRSLAEMLKNAYPATLEHAAIQVEWAAVQRDWNVARRLSRKLVATVEGFGLLCAPHPVQWVPLAEAARGVGRAVMRQSGSDLQIALTCYRHELALLGKTDSNAVMRAPNSAE